MDKAEAMDLTAAMTRAASNRAVALALVAQAASSAARAALDLVMILAGARVWAAITEVAAASMSKARAAAGAKAEITASKAASGTPAQKARNTMACRETETRVRVAHHKIWVAREAITMAKAQTGTRAVVLLDGASRVAARTKAEARVGADPSAARVCPAVLDKAQAMASMVAAPDRLRVLIL